MSLCFWPATEDYSDLDVGLGMFLVAANLSGSRFSCMAHKLDLCLLQLASRVVELQVHVPLISAPGDVSHCDHDPWGVFHQFHHIRSPGYHLWLLSLHGDQLSTRATYFEIVRALNWLETAFWVKWYLSKGVQNVVNLQLPSSRLTWWKPSLQRTLALLSSGKSSL